MLEKIQYYYTLGLYKQSHLDKLLEVEAITRTTYKKIIKGEQCG